ncbi:hypothetical protein AAZX31_17G098400 [Glycine max]|uniref:HNH nuclease domain-containing protein n=2 Tax=Glycine subgen. Soja TaxID=1462606 RepID=I1MTU7_SOYBN|nr:uncharacterized protein LOC100500174 [Glycine max]XP_028208630.1 uncharacterized protein LOC114391841 [Glycine soja]KAG4930034.1 hypothetical protein JHK86_046995 [Glycine max]KAG4942922.1 hypothetical protein JHK85_047568 [Glycine max]KAG5102038.1 hypothetical protein JHK84_047007 [Glycine max]KAH1117756.1 hypothetical protein GYH30_046837 [Glycine max]KRH03489.1 hypothetical protein GLYMA_17G101100v4 [Glycine max]|eukprot:NP_001237956.2 uncharacterized protein LOC100500174 [Glycine max]
MNQMRGISGSGSSSREARRRKARSTSPVKDRSKTSSSKLTSSSSSSKRSTSPSATLLDVDDDVTSLFHDYPSPNPNPNPNPRSFPHSVKQKCWEKADKVKGRDPDRWRRDALGNTLFRKLVGCPGCLCHDYDHIIPYSKGGESTLENCQVLQATVNRSKGNRTEISKAELIQKSSYCRVSDRDMDLLELSAYGNVRRGPDSGGCRIQ